MPLPKLKYSLRVKLAFGFCAIDLRISFLASKKNYSKLSVKLEQSGHDLAQSVKLRV